MNAMITLDQVWQAGSVSVGVRLVPLIGMLLFAVATAVLTVGVVRRKRILVSVATCGFVFSAIFVFIAFDAYNDEVAVVNAQYGSALQGLLEQEVDGVIEVEDGETLPVWANQTSQVTLTDRSGDVYPCTLFTDNVKYNLICDGDSGRVLVE